MNLWLLIVLVAVLTFAIKAAGPIALGGRELPPSFSSIVTYMPAAVLAALVVTAALANGQELSVGPAPPVSPPPASSPGAEDR